MTPGMIIDADGHTLVRVVDGQPVGDIDPVVAGWFKNGVPGLKSYEDGDVIEEMPTVIAPTSPVFLLAVMEEAERRNWTVVDEATPEQKSEVGDKPAAPFGEEFEKSGTHEGAVEGWETRKHGPKLEADRKDVEYGGPVAKFNAATEKRLNDAFSKEHGFVNGQRTVVASNGQSVIFTIKDVQPTFSIYSHDAPPKPQWELRGRVGKSNLQVRAFQTDSKKNGIGWWINATHKWSGSGDMTSFERLADHIADRALDNGLVEPLQKSGTSAGAKLGWEHRKEGVEDFFAGSPVEPWQEDLMTKYGSLQDAPPAADDVYSIEDEQLRLGRRVHGMPERDWVDQQNWDRHLTDAHNNAIGVYVGDDDSVINKSDTEKSLRGQEQPPEEYDPNNYTTIDASRVRETIQTLDDAFQKVAPIDEPILVLRGVSSVSFAKMLEKHIGGSFRDPGYVSTTIDPLTAYSFGRYGHNTNMILSVKIPAGSHVVPASGDEGELLLPRNSRFKVLRADASKGRAELEYVPDV